jgi:hypothetical protein
MSAPAPIAYQGQIAFRIRGGDVGLICGRDHGHPAWQTQRWDPVTDTTTQAAWHVAKGLAPACLGGATVTAVGEHEIILIGGDAQATTGVRSMAAITRIDTHMAYYHPPQR